MASMGKPWEIMRRNVPVSPGSSTTRVTDLYTKQGGGTSSMYTTILSLAVDYGVGFSITSAASPAGDLFVLRDLFDEVFLPALEETQRRAAVGLFGGQYKDAETNSSATVTVVEGEPALFLPVITSEGTDYLDTIRQALGLGYKGFGAFLYPMGLVSSFFVVLLWFGGRLLTDFAGQRRQDCVPRDVGCARQDGAPRVRELGRARPREVRWVSGGSVHLSCWKGRQGDGVGDSPHGQDYAQGLGVVRGEGPGQWTGYLVFGGGNL